MQNLHPSELQKDEFGFVKKNGKCVQPYKPRIKVKHQLKIPHVEIFLHVKENAHLNALRQQQIFSFARASGERKDEFG